MTSKKVCHRITCASAAVSLVLIVKILKSIMLRQRRKAELATHIKIAGRQKGVGEENRKSIWILQQSWLRVRTPKYCVPDAIKPRRTKHSCRMDADLLILKSTQI